MVWDDQLTNVVYMDTKLSEKKDSGYERSLAFIIHDVARLMRVRFDREVREVGLTRAQWFVLGHVVRTEGQTQTALAEETDMEKAPLGKVLDRLEEGGWIKRRLDPKDRRAKRVYKTAEVDPLIPFMEAVAERVEQVVLAGFDDRKKEQLIDVFISMKHNLLAPLEPSHVENGADQDGKKPPA